VRARPGGAEALSARLGGARVNGRSVELLCAPAEKMARLRQIGALGAEVEDVELRPPSLDEIYRHFARADGAEGAP
jgi:Cu-processing system ATP-binding protein